MKGFTNTTKMRSGHGFATGGTINRVATGGTINRLKKGGRPGYAEGGKVGGLDEHQSDMNGHSAVQRSESSTEELKDYGGKTPLTAGYAGGGKTEKHFHVHNHFHNGKKMPGRKAIKKAEGGIIDNTRPVAPDYAKGGKSMKPGGGGRFAKLKGELAKKPGVTNPGALAASIGRKKYGAEKMSHFAAEGQKKATGGTINRLAAGGAMYAGGGKVHEDAAQDRQLIKQEISRTRLKVP